MSDYGETYHPEILDLGTTETRTLGRFALIGDGALVLSVRIEVRNPVFGADSPLWFTLPDQIRVTSGTMHTIRTEKRMLPVEGVCVPHLTPQQLTTDRMVVYFPTGNGAELAPYVPTNQAFITAHGVLRIDTL